MNASPRFPVDYDVIIVGGGPAGATAATELAAAGSQVLLIDREGRIKPCGGAVPPRLIRDFDIPQAQISARIKGARIIAPSSVGVDMAIGDGYVGMVDREHFDPFLRDRAKEAGADRMAGTVKAVEELADGRVAVTFRHSGTSPAEITATARLLIGADGANSTVRRLCFPAGERPPYVFAYHEIVRSPEAGSGSFDPQRCDVYYQGRVSPDFYGWVFPHGPATSVGVGSAVKGFDLKAATKLLREAAGLGDQEILREEGAPLPLRPLKRWDNGRNVLLVGDAAGVVAPASGEGIYYAMLCGRLAVESAVTFLETRDARALSLPRKRFMRDHGNVFLILRLMQGFWYSSEKRRERFVAICADPDVQRLTWESYLEKRLVRTDPMAHLRVFAKDLRHMVKLAFT